MLLENYEGNRWLRNTEKQILLKNLAACAFFSTFAPIKFKL